LKLVWILGFGIWNFHSIGMDLFLKVLHKDPIVHLFQHLVGHTAIRTDNHIARLFISIQWNIGLADRTCQIFYHEIPPQIIAVDFLVTKVLHFLDP